MKKDNVELICSIGELSDLFREKSDVRGFLQKVVKTVSTHMNADASSIYLYDEHQDQLILEASEGLNAQLIGKLILAPGEGLAGTSMKELRSILEKNGPDNILFKDVPHSGEHRFKAFLAVPILSGLTRIGVLVVQHQEAGFFNKNDLMALKAIASQLAATLENAKLLMGITKKISHPKKIENVSIVRGQAIVAGIGIGGAYVINNQDKDGFYGIITPECRKAKEEDLTRALIQTEEQLQQLQLEMEKQLSDVGSLIFSTHLLMLRDSSFTGKIEDEVRSGTTPCDAIVARVEYFVKIFSENDNPRLREKVQDIRDLGHRLLRNLSGESQETGDYSGQILVARELLPSELVKITAQQVEGLVLYSQGASAHITILAKSLGVPLVYTDDKRIFSIDSGTSLILDGLQGTLLINPKKDSLKQFRILKEDYELSKNQEIPVSDRTFSLDNQRIYLRATINLISDIETALAMKAEGIGLYRSEFPFLIRNNFPSEEEQYLVYKKIFIAMDHPLITLRALDIGGDKILSYVPDSEEDNPFLGLRAIRFLLENKKIFVGQLKAMLRAGQGRKFRIMFPLISSLDDFRQARHLVEKSIEFLKRDGFVCDSFPELGVMIELPSAVMMAEDLAREADFISVGSNDLVQYLLGVDRTNEKVSGLYEARHPAVLKSIALIVEAAEKEKCDLSVCGNIAFNKEMVYFMMGLGIRSFSVPPVKIPGLQRFINTVDIAKAEKDSQALLGINTLEEIHKYFESLMTGKRP